MTNGHYYEGNTKCGFPKTYKQLDYILLSKTLADSNPSSIPKIIRKGLPLEADTYTGPRFEGVGKKAKSIRSLSCCYRN